MRGGGSSGGLFRSHPLCLVSYPFLICTSVLTAGRGVVGNMDIILQNVCKYILYTNSLYMDHVKHAPT